MLRAVRALHTSALLAVLALAALGAGCGDDDADRADPSGAAGGGELDLEGEPVDPPFEVAGDAHGLLLVWFDEDGLHTADTRDDIPEARRSKVRVDSLRLAPDDRLDPAYVWVADLSAPGDDGQYPVRKLARAAFEALVDRESGVELAQAEGQAGGSENPDADVIIYGAEWCGACNQAAHFFEQNGVDYVEKDIEQDPAARQEMQAKARAAGVHPNGIPVIDFRGTLVTGFDPARLQSLIHHGAAPI